MIKVIAFDLNGVLFPTPKGVNNRVLAFIKECKSLGYMVVAASNTSKRSFEWRSRRYGLMNVFDGRIISSDIGTRKPSKKFFEYMIEILGCLPEEILFVDDSDTNIDTAKELGIITVKYNGEKSLEDVRKALK